MSHDTHGQPTVYRGVKSRLLCYVILVPLLGGAVGEFGRVDQTELILLNVFIQTIEISHLELIIFFQYIFN